MCFTGVFWQVPSLAQNRALANMRMLACMQMHARLQMNARLHSVPTLKQLIYRQKWETALKAFLRRHTATCAALCVGEPQCPTEVMALIAKDMMRLTEGMVRE